jgi:hypothetical protein
VWVDMMFRWDGRVEEALNQRTSAGSADTRG